MDKYAYLETYERIASKEYDRLLPRCNKRLLKH